MASSDKQVSEITQAPIGLFDSGVGGLSVLRALRQELPREKIVYLADQANVPYGPRGLEEVQTLTHAAANFLMERGAKLILIACNTASAAALKYLRERYPNTPFVGMEPALKPAVEHTETGVVGVLATPTTFAGNLYASVAERFASDVQLLQSTLPGLVIEIEAGRANGEKVERILREALEPMMAQNMDTVVLGCTHYPFVFDTIRHIVGPDVRLVDPAPSIARRTAAQLDESGLLNGEGDSGKASFYTSGDTAQMQKRIQELIGIQAEVEQVVWNSGKLI